MLYFLDFLVYLEEYLEPKNYLWWIFFAKTVNSIHDRGAGEGQNARLLVFPCKFYKRRN